MPARTVEGDVIRNIRDYIQYIGHFDTAGNPSRNEMDENHDLYYPICRAIAATDYDGYVGQEFTPKGDPLAGLEQARKGRIRHRLGRGLGRCLILFYPH